jgi:hypothetical protein
MSYGEARCPRVEERAAMRSIACLWIGLLCASGLSAQSPEEHASHHPGQATGAMPAAGAMLPGGISPALGATPAGAGGMMAGMGEMMKGMMGAPPAKELYPTLMALPLLTPAQRKQVEQQAGERMHVGTMLMGQALDTLNAGSLTGDYAAMHEAMTRLREGAAQLDSGIAARRALAEGRAPSDVALAWFRREMSLVAPVRGEASHGLSPLHLFTMALLVVFAFAMLAMYFFKMRRAAALFGRIEPDKGSPPPGSAPELAAGKPTSKAKPASGSKPPAGNKPPSTSKPAAPDDDPAALADKSAASAGTPAADAPQKAS